MIEDKVRAYDLLGVLDAHTKGVKVLTLDCFDTILWRRTATPSDVFYDLAHAPAFKAAGLSARLRAQAETVARSFRKLNGARAEVRLNEIYPAAFPELTPAAITELAEAELAAEMDACFAFPPTVELIRAARARGLRVAVVSDTYLDEPQLRRLLASALPADAMAAIERIFCSSEYRQGKSDGLFEKVIAELRVKPTEILHVGDHPHADLIAARQAGAKSIQLVHHQHQVMELLRLQGTAMALLDPLVRSTASVTSPFHAVLAQRRGIESDHELLGYAAAGPVLYAFGRFILDEIAALETEGKRVKPLFLMRDAYLPREVCGAITGAPVGHPVSISRFASYAASFRTVGDIERYLARFVGSKRFEDLARQLLLPEKLARKIIDAAKQKNSASVDEFVRRVRRPDVVATIIERSRAYCARMKRYLETFTPIERGDTLLFVDLGYEGTAQRLLEPVLRAEWGVEVVGRYLIVISTPGWAKSRKGLLDPANTDERVTMALVDQIALVEDICTADMDSVVDYAEDGKPLWGPRVIEREQIERVKPVQEACVAFARDAEALFAATGRRPDPAILRRAALGHLGRMSYFPTEHEIRYLENFHLDMNMATSDTFRLFDREKGVAGLRKRGLFFMEHNLKAKRMNYPMELRYAGLELAVTFLAAQRFQLGFVHSDFALRKEAVPYLLHKGEHATQGTNEARATHDGFFAVVVPVGMADMNAMLLFGQRYTWIQIESMELVATHALYQDHESHCTQDISGEVVLDGMVERGPGLYECVSPAAFAFVPARAQPEGTRMACRIVFRPIAWRELAPVAVPEIGPIQVAAAPVALKSVM